MNSLTVGRRDGELLGDGEVGEEHEEEPQQEPNAEVLLSRTLHALDELHRIAPHHLSRLRRARVLSSPLTAPPASLLLVINTCPAACAGISRPGHTPTTLTWGGDPEPSGNSSTDQFFAWAMDACMCFMGYGCFPGLP